VFRALSHLLHFYTPKFQKQDLFLCSGAGPVMAIDPDMIGSFDKNSDRDKKKGTTLGSGFEDFTRIILMSVRVFWV